MRQALQCAMFALRLGKCTFEEINASKFYQLLNARDLRLGPLDEFKHGAVDAYKFLHEGTTSNDNIDQLKEVCSPKIFSIIQQERLTDESNFQQFRDMHTEEELQTEWLSMNAFLTSVSCETDEDIVIPWEKMGEHIFHQDLSSYRFAVTFLSTSKAVYLPQIQSRADTLEFVADADKCLPHLGDWVIKHIR